MHKFKVTRIALTFAISISSVIALAAKAPIPAPVVPTATPAISAPTGQQPTLIPAPPNINAKAYVLMDVDSGDIIASKNMNAKRPPASLTKLMTLYLASRALKSGVIKIDDKVMISKKAWKTGGSRMFV